MGARPRNSFHESFSEALQPQDLTLDLIATYVRPTGNLVWSGALVRLLEDFGFSAAASRIALGRLVRRGLLGRLKEGRLVFYRPSETLLRVLDEGDKRIYGFGLDDHWDGLWTFLWYSVPDELRVERRRLSRRLRFLGFGPLQDGTWLAPRDRETDATRVVDDLGLNDYVVMFVGRPAKTLDLRRLTGDVWDLDGLADRYEAFVAEFSPYDKAAVRRKLQDRDAFLVRTRAIDAFRRFPAMDPWLPEHVIGRRWKRQQAVRTFHRIDKALAEPSARYFDEISRPPARAPRTGRRS